MAEIVVSGEQGSFRVAVTDGASTTEHEVVVPAGFLSKLGLDAFEERAVVEESFRFLLEREPKEAIMRRFDLGVIEGFFGEYPEEIRRRFSER